MRKTLAIIVTLVVLGTSIQTAFAPRAQAILGIGDIVIDPAKIAQSAWQFVEDQILPTFLSALKQRIINTMTDEIIAWINNGGKPQFITNFGQQVFQPAFQQAVGDTAQSLLPTLCSPYTFKVNLELSAPQPLNQPSSCTLNSIVSNFNAFRQNFAVGGFIGYSELLAPQNNQYGVDIIAQDALYNNVQQVTTQNALQTQVNVGFNSPQVCYNWFVINNQNQQKLTAAKTISDTNGKPYEDPGSPPPMTYDTLSQTGVDTHSRDFMVLSQLSWECGDLQVATPGRVFEQGLNKALYANLDLAINDSSISNAIAMIADAAFNRLIKAGVNGLQGILLSASNSNKPSSGAGAPTVDQIVNNPDIQNANDTYNSAQNQAIQNQYLVQLNQAAKSLADASTTLQTASTTNQSLITAVLQPLVSCLGTNSSSSDLGWAQGNLTIAVSSTPVSIYQMTVQVASSTNLINVWLATLNTPTISSSTLDQFNSSAITETVSSANGLDLNAQTTLSNIQAALTAGQTKLTQCQATH